MLPKPEANQPFFAMTHWKYVQYLGLFFAWDMMHIIVSYTSGTNKDHLTEYYVCNNTI